MAFSDKLLNPGEHIVVTTRTHPKALIVPALMFAIVLTAAVWAASYVEGTIWWALISGFAAGLIVAFSVVPLLRWLTTTYTFTDRRFIKRSGVVAKEGRTIPLNRISGVDFEMGVVDRMFGCGTLIVSDASTNGRVVLDDIPRIEHVQLVVAEELAKLGGHQDRGHDDGT